MKPFLKRFCMMIIWQSSSMAYKHLNCAHFALQPSLPHFGLTYYCLPTNFSLIDNTFCPTFSVNARAQPDRSSKVFDPRFYPNPKFDQFEQNLGWAKVCHPKNPWLDHLCLHDSTLSPLLIICRKIHHDGFKLPDDSNTYNYRNPGYQYALMAATPHCLTI